MKTLQLLSIFLLPLAAVHALPPWWPEPSEAYAKRAAAPDADAKAWPPIPEPSEAYAKRTVVPEAKAVEGIAARQDAVVCPYGYFVTVPPLDPTAYCGGRQASECYSLVSWSLVHRLTKRKFNMAD